MAGDLEKLEDWWDALLLAQAGALLHNMGKVTPQFLNKMASNKTDQQFMYQHILHLIEEDCRDLQRNIPKLYYDLHENENKNDFGYLFCWDEIPGNDNEILIEFLNRHFAIEWVKTAKIEKIDDYRAIKVSNDINYLSLSLNDEKTTVCLKIDDDRTYKFITKTENDKLNIYIFNALKQSFTLPHPFNDRCYRPGDMIEYLGQGDLVFGKKLYDLPYLFNWDMQSKKDKKNLKKYIKHNYDIENINNIEKSDDDMTIQISCDNHSILLELNEKKTVVNLKIYDVRTVKLIVKTEHNQLKVYAPPCWITKIFQGDSRLTSGSRLTHLMNRSHRGASAGEKQDICVSSQEEPNKLYKSTPFGWESAAPNLNDIDKHKYEIENIIQNHISPDIKLLNFDYFANKLRPHLEAAIADLRRPINDVTVWDIGHSGMAFLLTQAIGMIIQKRDIDHGELAKVDDENTLFWRVLSVRMDGLGYLEAASSLVDLRVRYLLLQKTLERVRNTLEGMPVAIEVYRDENGSFYVFPDLPKEHQFTKDVLNNLQSKLIVDGVSLNCILSKQPLVNHPNDKGGQYIGEYISKCNNNEHKQIYDTASYTVSWKSEQNKEICIACGVRPQGYGADQVQDYNKNPKFYSEKACLRKICCLCMDLRRDVAKNWATEGLHDSTVWIDEIADKYGRLALLVGQLDLQKWDMWYPKEIKHSFKFINFGKDLINGDKITLKDKNTSKSEKFKYNYTDNVLEGVLDKIHEVSKFGNNSIKNIKIDNIEREDNKYKITLCESHGETINQQCNIENIQFIANGEKTLRTVDQNAANKVKNKFLHDKILIITDCHYSLEMAESQSFARIRRVWETTRNFWQDILPTKAETEISKSEGCRVLGLTGPRLAITGDLTSEHNISTPGPYHTYLLRLKNTNLSVVWDSNNQRFITADNLDAIAEPTRLGEKVESWLEAHIGKNIPIEEPTGYGSQNKTWGSIKIEKVEQIPDSKYTPAIPILAEPRTFMALVPADKALDLVTKINEKYEREMGKVRNRLPLHMGVVFSPHKTPLRTILDAGRRMMVEKTASVDGWEVVEKENLAKDDKRLPETLRNPHFTECVRLKLTREHHTAVWHVPLMMGDSKTKDNWYPYVFVKHDKNEKTPSGRKRMFEAPCPWNLDADNNPQPTWLVHAKDVEEHDVIYFTPSTLDFQWLDTSGRRFEIDYDKGGQRRDMPQRPYMLDDLDILQNEIWKTLRCHLTTSQIHTLYELIETKRYEWEVSDSKVFHNFCRDAIANLEWKKLKLNDSKENVYPWKNDTKPPEKDWLTQWADYAVRGWLSDVIELYMKVLKEKPENNCEEIV